MNGASASAQTVTASSSIGTAFDRNRTVAVGDRVQPGYEPLGIQAGSFTIQPKLAARLLLSDNILADAVAPKADAVAELSPSFLASSNWSRHAISLAGSVTAARHARITQENSQSFNVQAQGRFDAGGNLSIQGFGGYLRQIQNRFDPGALRGTASPVSFDLSSAGVGVTWQPNRTRFSAEARTAKIAYADVALANGLTVQSLGLDRRQNQYQLRGEYAVTADLAVLVQARLTDLRYVSPVAGSGLDRSSRKAEFLAGINFEFTDFLRGEFAVGYVGQNYRSPAFTDFGGFGGRVRLQYFPSGLTTVRLDASRTVEEAGNPASPSYVRSVVGLHVDHELYRNLVISAGAEYSRNRFDQPVRTDRRTDLSLGAVYRCNRHLSVVSGFRRLHIAVSDVATRRALTIDSITAGLSFEP
ncbi:outer membrane beta-barrel protein [Novosphingobium lentum]|uniref:outer membrane beta-barrel protein n=1 Tax=Novosphingobium lentum TaxID=145287 RepID=UPI001470126C|nr:outer membrane beta-barrel protein [Novosphingobium lentum]